MDTTYHPNDELGDNPPGSLGIYGRKEPKRKDNEQAWLEWRAAKLWEENKSLTAEVERLREETDATILEARHLYEHVTTHREYADFVIRIAKRQLHLEGGA